MNTSKYKSVSKDIFDLTKTTIRHKVNVKISYETYLSATEMADDSINNIIRESTYWSTNDAVIGFLYFIKDQSWLGYE